MVTFWERLKERVKCVFLHSKTIALNVFVTLAGITAVLAQVVAPLLPEVLSFLQALDWATFLKDYPLAAAVMVTTLGITGVILRFRTSTPVGNPDKGDEQ